MGSIQSAKDDQEHPPRFRRGYVIGGEEIATGSQLSVKRNKDEQVHHPDFRRQKLTIKEQNTTKPLILGVKTRIDEQEHTLEGRRHHLTRKEDINCSAPILFNRNKVAIEKERLDKYKEEGEEENDNADDEEEEEEEKEEKEPLQRQKEIEKEIENIREQSRDLERFKAAVEDINIVELRDFERLYSECRDTISVNPMLIVAAFGSPEVAEIVCKWEGIDVDELCVVPSIFNRFFKGEIQTRVSPLFLATFLNREMSVKSIIKYSGENNISNCLKKIKISDEMEKIYMNDIAEKLQIKHAELNPAIIQGHQMEKDSTRTRVFIVYSTNVTRTEEYQLYGIGVIMIRNPYFVRKRASDLTEPKREEMKEADTKKAQQTIVMHSKMLWENHSNNIHRFGELPEYNNGSIQQDLTTVGSSQMFVKFGSETHLTKGVMSVYGPQVRPLRTVLGLPSNRATFPFKNQYEINGIPTFGDVFLPGDSGSAVFIMDPIGSLHCIGMAIGRTKVDTGNPSAVVTPIRAILNALGPSYRMATF